MRSPGARVVVPPGPLLHRPYLALSYRARGLWETLVVSVLLLLIFPALVTAAVPEAAEDLSAVPGWLLPGALMLLGSVLSTFGARSHARREEPEAAEDDGDPAAGPPLEGAAEESAEEVESLSTLRPDTLVAHRVAIERAVVAMHERLEENLTLKEMASRAFVSPYHFNRIFRQLVGIPPGQFLGALRLQEAKRLLVTTDLSVTDICFQVGYSSLGTFTRRFTSLVGFCPRHFRALAKRPSVPWNEISIGPRPIAQEAALSGQIQTVDGFWGIAFVGLFDSPIPQGAPAACALAVVPGPFSLPNCPDGDFHLLAVGLSPAGSHLEQILFEGMPRGTHDHRALRIRGGRADQPINVVLRQPDFVDPPILVTPYLFLQQHFTGAVKSGPKRGRGVRAISEKPAS